MRIFEDKHEGIQYTLKTKQEEEFIIETLPITIDDYDKATKLNKKFQKEQKIEYMVEMLQLIFGKDKEFWNMFSINLLVNLMMAVSEDLSKKNLTEPVGSMS